MSETMGFAMANYAPGNQVGSNRIPNTRISAFVALSSNPWMCIFFNIAGPSISYLPASRSETARSLHTFF